MPTFTYVYILQSTKTPSKQYVGITKSLPSRFAAHNAGKVQSTRQHRPWTIQTAIAFSDRARASAFERYLKTGSGRAFRNTHL